MPVDAILHFDERCLGVGGCRSRSRDRDRKRSETPPRRKPRKKSNWDAPPDAATAAAEGTEINNPQLTFKARRIYVGNLPNADPPLTDVSLREFFDQAMLAAGLTNGEGSCVSDVWISAEKQFAFVEVRSIAEAANAMQLDGITLFGTPLRINRPHDYVPPGALSDPAMMHAGPGGIPGGATNLTQLMQLTKKSRRLHVGNLPIQVPLSPNQLRTFVAGVMQQMCLTVKVPRHPAAPPPRCPAPHAGRLCCARRGVSAADSARGPRSLGTLSSTRLSRRTGSLGSWSCAASRRRPTRSPSQGWSSWGGPSALGAPQTTWCQPRTRSGSAWARASSACRATRASSWGCSARRRWRPARPSPTCPKQRA